MIKNFRVMSFGDALLAFILIAGLVVFCPSTAKSDETKPSDAKGITSLTPYKLDTQGNVIISTGKAKVAIPDDRTLPDIIAEELKQAEKIKNAKAGDAGNLKQIGLGIYMYADKHEGKIIKYIRNPSQTPLVITHPGLFKDNFINVLYADVHVSGIYCTYRGSLSPNIIKADPYTFTATGAIIEATSNDTVAQPDISYKNHCLACGYVLDQRITSTYPKGKASIKADFICPICGNKQDVQIDVDKTEKTKPIAEASSKFNSPKIVKTGTYTLTVTGAVIRSTRVSQNDTSLYYVKQCQACCYVSDEQTGSKYPKDGGSLISDFTCPKCGNKQDVRIDIAKSKPSDTTPSAGVVYKEVRRKNANALGTDISQKFGDVFNENTETIYMAAAPVQDSLLTTTLMSSNKYENAVSHTYKLIGKGIKMSSDEAAKLEKEFEERPDDFNASAQLLGFYYNAWYKKEPDAGKKLGEFILSLIKSHPEAAVLGSNPYGQLAFNNEKYAEAQHLWAQQVEKNPKSIPILMNAVKSAFKQAGESTERYLLQARALELDSREISQKLADFYMISREFPGADKKDLAAKELAELTKLYKRPEYGVVKSMLLPRMAKAALEIPGELDFADKEADLMLSLIGATSEEWSAGELFYYGYFTKGMVAFKRGDTNKAVEFLLKSAETSGSPVFNRGPNMSLAKALLEAGQKDAVLEFLDKCGKFWKYDRSKREKWISEIKDGKIPDFGDKLYY